MGMSCGLCLPFLSSHTQPSDSAWHGPCLAWVWVLLSAPTYPLLGRATSGSPKCTGEPVGKKKVGQMTTPTGQRAWKGRDKLQRTGIPMVLASGSAATARYKEGARGFACRTAHRCSPCARKADVATDTLLAHVQSLQKHVSAGWPCLMPHWKPCRIIAAPHHPLLADTDRRTGEDLEQKCTTASPFSPEKNEKGQRC